MHKLPRLGIQTTLTLTMGYALALHACGSDEPSRSPASATPENDAAAGGGGHAATGSAGTNAGGTAAGTGGSSNTGGKTNTGGANAGGENGTAVSCDPAPDDLPCYACGKQACCAEFKALHSAHDYDAFYSCLAECQSDACLTGCVSRYAAGAEFTKYDACRTTACSDSCRPWQCVDQPNDKDCAKCANSNCCSEYIVLMNASDELAFAECWLGCASDACRAACFTANQLAGAAYTQFDHCRTAKCPGTCQPWQCSTTSDEGQCAKCSKDKCCAEHVGLVNSSDYAGFTQCWTDCNGSLSCTNACVSGSTQAGPAYAKLDECRKTNCAASCPQ